MAEWIVTKRVRPNGDTDYEIINTQSVSWVRQKPDGKGFVIRHDGETLDFDAVITGFFNLEEAMQFISGRTGEGDDIDQILVNLRKLLDLDEYSSTLDILRKAYSVIEEWFREKYNHYLEGID